MIKLPGANGVDSGSLPEEVVNRFRGLAALAAVLIILPAFLPNTFYVDVANRVAILAMNAIMLNLLMGYTGQISLGHAGFFGLGAYGSAILTARYNVPPLGGLILSAVVTALLSWAVARVILRLRGHYLAMATLGLGVIITIVLTNEAQWTGGPDGMPVGRFSVLGYSLAGERQWYWVFAVLLFATVVITQNLINSPAGRALQALHGSEVAATVAGVDVRRRKMDVFVLSATVSSILGSLGAHYFGYINPGIADFVQSTELVIIVVFGGMASIYGALIGAVIIGILPQFLAGYDGWDVVAFGVILAATMIFLPRGLVPSLAAAMRPKRGATC
ncbi:branched-chain amino acid ABC transporter permease [Paramagnetospirillum caucaseum]|uniref:Branched-chain amino acid ABC transporter permease n=1 Tax=Paramagnetospirillum caucaseum TaxID=1244869 RepID=M3A904_9PROT|nr:branched-chain amino acid ABC transporter permease [Paramagnetospirillum caucaseum]EME69268.1 branched-chain amino acid ABC transporter permease [Paramagnetospirillum caucaseum]